MEFKSKKEARDYMIKGGMTPEKAKTYVDENHKDLPENPEMKVIKKEEVQGEFDNIDTRIGGVEESVESAVDIANKTQEDITVIKNELVKLNRDGGIEVHTKVDETFGYSCMEEFAIELVMSDKQGEKTEKLVKMGETIDRMKAVGSPTMSTFLDDNGGFLIPPEFSNQILEVEVENNDFFKRATSIPMSSNSITVPYVDGFDQSSGVIFGNVLALWAKELDALTGKNPKFGTITLTLNKLTGLAYASSEMIEDSPQSIAGMLTRMFGTAMGYATDKALYAGTGAGQPLGILNAAAKVEVPKEGGQPALTIVPANIVKMFSRAWGRMSDFVWVANKNVIPQLYLMTVDVGTGGTVAWMPGNSMAGSPHQTLMGIPLIFSDHAKSLGTAGDIALVNWKHYLVGEKTGRGLQSAVSIHLKFDFDQSVFKITKRLDGQPWWKTVRTPENGATLAPVVTLAARTT